MYLMYTGKYAIIFTHERKNRYWIVTEFVDFGKRAQKVPAKIDTGADSSAVWASNIRIGKDGVLVLLFGKGSPYYNGKIFKRTDYTVAMCVPPWGKSKFVIVHIFG